ncbi:hypothetical protein NMY22_g19177 [Coprinellus aureogranulatus]|nr:hypothetical protein NMY22_g19177 [Coprinellus aureogranulatus]
MQATCTQCALGQGNVCPKATLIGVGGRGGGLAEFISVDVENVHRLPANVSLEAGAMLEPLAVAYHAVKRSGFKPGQTALVSGAGPVSSLTICLQLRTLILVARSIDPNATIIVSEPIQVRRDLAVKYGATDVADPLVAQGIVLAKVYGETFGAGVDVTFETSGAQDGLDNALTSVKPHGSLVNVAIWQQSPHVNMNLLNAREIRLTGVMGYGAEYPVVLQALATGQVAGLEDLVTKKVRLEKVVQEGLVSLASKKENDGEPPDYETASLAYKGSRI